MIFLTGFSEDEVRLIKEAFDDIPVYEIPSYCGDWVLSEVIEKADSLEGSGGLAREEVLSDARFRQ